MSSRPGLLVSKRRMASSTSSIATEGDTKVSRGQLSHQNSESGVSDELEILSNVYFEELEVLGSDSEGTKLKFHITPSTGDNKELQYVYLDLRFSLPPSYPHVPPVMTTLQSRGLADPQLRGIQEGVGVRATELLGSPMVYELVEFVRDHLTDHNRPCGQCALCQFDFLEDEEFVKTECYHYFHTPCLLRYVRYHHQLGAEAGEEERERGEGRERGEERERGTEPKLLECPVCRETISHDIINLSKWEGEGEGEEFVFMPSQSLRQWQCQMAVLLQQQKERGGVIDLTDKDVIDLTWVSLRTQETVASVEANKRKVTRGGGHKRVCANGRPRVVQANSGSLEEWIQDTATESRAQAEIRQTDPRHSNSKHSDSGYSNSKYSNSRYYSRSRYRHHRPGNTDDMPGEGRPFKTKRISEKRTGNGTSAVQSGNETVGKEQSGNGTVGEEQSGNGTVGEEQSGNGKGVLSPETTYNSLSTEVLNESGGERGKQSDSEGLRLRHTTNGKRRYDRAEIAVSRQRSDYHRQDQYCDRRNDARPERGGGSGRQRYRVEGHRYNGPESGREVKYDSSKGGRKDGVGERGGRRDGVGGRGGIKDGVRGRRDGSGGRRGGETENKARKNDLDTANRMRRQHCTDREAATS